jgi:hypothetical protein
MGLTTVLAVRWAGPSVSRSGQLAVLVAWSVGGVASAWTANYNVLKGWSVMSTIGATVTALTTRGEVRLVKSLQTLSLVICCVLGGVGGSLVVSRSEIIVGQLLAWAIRGRTVPYIVSATASGVGGIIAGFVGGCWVLWCTRRGALS